MLTLQMAEGSALCSTKKQLNELSNTSSKSNSSTSGSSSSSSSSSSSGSSSSSSSSSSSDVYILSSGGFLRYSKSDFGGIHVHRTSLILCGSFKNMRLFIQQQVSSKEVAINCSGQWYRQAIFSVPCIMPFRKIC